MDKIKNIILHDKKINTYKVIFAFTLLFVLTLISLMYGQRIYSPIDIFKILTKQSVRGYFTIVHLRIPKTIIGLLAGFSFGIAGNTFQKLLRNPLASPDIIGVTSGSSVAAVFCILVLNMSGIFVSIIAIISGLLTTLLIYYFSYKDGFSYMKLILIGIGIQAFLSAIINWILLKTAQYNVSNALRWLSGSLNNTTIEMIPMILFSTLFGTCMILVLSKDLDLIALGDDLPKLLGSHVSKVQVLLLIGSLILNAFSISLVGPIASIAFLSGPIAKNFIKSGKANILLSGCIGSILVLFSELIGQNFLPHRYPVGVITGIFGALYLIYLLVKMRKTI